MSENEEMYLVTLARMVEAGEAPPIPLSRLAEELAIQPVSASQMVHRLQESGLVTYTPYRGAALSPEGERLALRILRSRRLWEVFLVDHLKVAPAEADDLACRLEHTLPARVAERLAAFLGHPAASPQGRPIPAASAAEMAEPEVLLTVLRVGQSSRVARTGADAAAGAFLTGQGIERGVVVTVLGVGDDGTRLVGVGGRSALLGAGIADRVWVQPPDAGVAANG